MKFSRVRFYYLYSFAIIGLWLLNYIFLWILYEYNDGINKLYMSRWIHMRIFRQKFFPIIFDESNMLWLPFLTQYMDKKEDLGKINDRVGITLQSSLFEFAVENGHQRLAKVFIQPNTLNK